MNESKWNFLGISLCSAGEQYNSEETLAQNKWGERKTQGLPNTSRKANVGKGCKSLVQWEDRTHALGYVFPDSLGRQKIKGSSGYGTSWSPFGYITLMWLWGQCVISQSLTICQKGCSLPEVSWSFYSKTKLRIVPLLYQGDVFTNTWAASHPQRTRTAKTIDQSIHQAREIPHYVHNRALVHRQLSEAAGVAQGPVTSVPVCDLHNAFLSPQHCPALEERQSPHLCHTLSSSSVLTPPLIPAPWVKHSTGRSSPLKAPLPSPSCASMQHKPPAPTTHSTSWSHFIFPVQSTRTPCMRTYLPAWRRVAQTSPTGEQCSEYGVAICVLILKTKLEKWPREQWQNFSSLF